MKFLCTLISTAVMKEPFKLLCRVNMRRSGVFLSKCDEKCNSVAFQTNIIYENYNVTYNVTT